MTQQQMFDKLKQEFNEALEISEDNSIYTMKENIIKLLQKLKEDYGFVMLGDITSIDFEDRFEVVYHLTAFENAQTIKIKVKLDKNNPSITTAIGVWKAADVQEREIFDLMGIKFEGHKNLARILCPENFEGHPLRKDFKLNLAARY